MHGVDTSTFLIRDSSTLGMRWARSAVSRGRGVGLTSAKMMVVNRASRMSTVVACRIEVCWLRGEDRGTDRQSGGGDSEDLAGDNESW